MTLDVTITYYNILQHTTTITVDCSVPTNMPIGVINQLSYSFGAQGLGALGVRDCTKKTLEFLSLKCLSKENQFQPGFRRDWKMNATM